MFSLRKCKGWLTTLIRVVLTIRVKGENGDGFKVTRAERREVKNKKVAKRLRLMGNLGMQAGTLYERHREKVIHSGGYMSKGNVSHYVAVRPRRYYDRNKDDAYGILCDCEEGTEV